MTKDEAIAWMYNYCHSITEDYDTIMGAAEAYLSCGEYYMGEEMGDDDFPYYGKFEGMGVPREFWDAYEVLKGVPFPITSFK